MADEALQPRTRHVIAVLALLISSVGGFAPQTFGRYHLPTSKPAEAGSSLLRSRRASLHCGGCQQRGEWGGIGEQRRPGGLCRQGLALGEATAVVQGNKSFLGGRGRSARGWRSETTTRRSTSAMMALHFPKPPKMPKPPPSSSDKMPAGGKSAGREASSTPAGSTAGSSSTSKGGAAGAVTAEGVVNVSGMTTKTRNVSVGHANATRADLNGGKVRKESNVNNQRFFYELFALLRTDDTADIICCCFVVEPRTTDGVDCCRLSTDTLSTLQLGWC